MMETHAFQAETQKLLDLMIHSLYSNKEVFLRELISNASDAIDRRRFEGLSKPELVSEEAPKIRLVADGPARTLVVEDDGIGMSREEVVEHLGTIARSGTLEFLKNAEAGDAAAPELIGQFGVGFYASFMVAEEVEVVTRRAGEGTATRWISRGDGSYGLEDAEREAAGTSIRLSLKPVDIEAGIADFTQEWTLRDVVKRYSDFVAYPIELVLIEAPAPAEGEEDVVDLPTRREIEEPLNSMKALWTRPESEVDEEDYAAFYKHLTRDGQDPLLRVRTTMEGTFEARALLYVPSTAPYDLYHREQQSRGVQLFVRRVFIMDECRELVPEWLRFIRGVVDSEDLPLNVSREMLQQDRQIRGDPEPPRQEGAARSLGRPDARRTRPIATWRLLGPVRAGPEGGAPRSSTRRRSASSTSCSPPSTAEGDKALTSLSAYVDRMPEDQEAIYFDVRAPKLGVLRGSPHLEAFREKRHRGAASSADPVDDVWLQPDAARSIADKRFRSRSGRGEVELGSDEEKKQAEGGARARDTETYKDLLGAIRAARAGRREGGAPLASAHGTSPSCLVLEEGDLSPQMEAMLRQAGPGAFRSASRSSS